VNSELEVHPDGWERFERAVDVTTKAPPQHRKARSKKEENAQKDQWEGRQMNSVTRRLILSALFALPSFGAAAQDTKFGTARIRDNKLPLMLGVASFPNPSESNQVVFSRQGEIETMQEVPSQQNFERQAGKFAGPEVSRVGIGDFRKP